MSVDFDAFHSMFEAVARWATTGQHVDDVMKAKSEFMTATGEVYTDDAQFEPRVQAFLDYYICDRVRAASGITPAAESRACLQLTPEVLKNVVDADVVSLLDTRHSLYELRKISPKFVVMKDSFSSETFEVQLERPMIGLEKGDIFEARIIPFRRELMLSQAMTFHASKVANLIRKEIKRATKAHSLGLVRDFVWNCAKRANRVERYKKVQIEKIYDFQLP